MAERRQITCINKTDRPNPHRLASIAALAIVFAVRSSFAQSECTRATACNATINNSLDFASGACLDANTLRYQLFTFNASAGTRLTVSVTSATFSPSVQLIDPGNSVVAGGSAVSTARFDYTLTATGMWTVRIMNTSVGTGGPYTLSISCGAAPPPPPPEPPPTAFQLTVSPSDVTLGRGASTRVTVSSRLIDTFESEIRVSTSGSPAGVTIDPGSFTFAAPGSGSTTVSIATTQSPTGGSFPIAFTGTASDGTARRTSLRLVIDAPCSPPVFFPSNTTVQTQRGTTATITANPSGTPPFAIQWFHGFSGSAFFLEPNGKSASFTTPPIFNDEQYWARVVNECGSADGPTILIRAVDVPPRHRPTRH